MRLLIAIMLMVFAASSSANAGGPHVLKADDYKRYIDAFSANDNQASLSDWGWIRDNVPLFDCPDKELTEIYYFRWYTYHKHIKSTPEGYVITEFLPDVGWAGKFNTISCAAGHHIYEGRWIRDPKYIDDYSVFWFRKGGEPRRYSFWAADAIWKRYLVTGDKQLPIELLPDLIANYKAWESDHLDPNGLFWQIDDRDGMEMSIGGSGYRATINSYMYGDAVAIANIADLAGRHDVAKEYRAKAASIKKLVQTKLWDAKSRFFKVLPRGENTRLVDVRELHGYTPWYFDLPDREFSPAWSQIKDAKGFSAEFGPSTAEQRDPKFGISYEGHECQWNGPSWPYSTSITLTAMANLLNDYKQDVISKADYFSLLKTYAHSQHLRLDDGRVVPWIDEDLNPFTGDWIARTVLKKHGGMPDRGKDYNHSTFCDLIITGLVGLRPSADGTIRVNPLVPAGVWDYFCLDNVPYHGHILTILYDKTGRRYHKGVGLQIEVDGRLYKPGSSL